MRDVGALRAHFARFGQEHVFAAWDRLDDSGRRRLADQAARLDLAALARVQRRLGAPEASSPHRLAPVAVERLASHGGDAGRRSEARLRGEAMLADGRVAGVVVAGGQGTRLGFDGPKGAFPIGPVTDRSLFEIQAQKIRNLRRRTGHAIPWCVMTSPATDAETREFFRKAGHFDLPEEDVFFFRQATVPSLDFQGRLLLAAPDRIFENPDGHGGCLTALRASGVLDALEERGIDTLFYYQVDNPLVRICDPVTLGYHEDAHAEMSCKVVRKTDPDEKVGVVALRDGLPVVVEYTELDDAARHARDAAGDLLYWAGNIAVHLFSTAFVRRIASDAEHLLPFHASAKPIPHVDAEGRAVSPQAPNGHKLERFVFDALPAAHRFCVVEADRAAEFSPVKSATGADSPDTARRDLIACYRSWLGAAGIALPAEAVAIEVDHGYVDGPEDAAQLGISEISQAGEIIRISSGDCP